MHPRIHAETQPDKPAIVMARSGESITYAELERRANRGPTRCVNWASPMAMLSRLPATTGWNSSMSIGPRSAPG